MVAITAPNSQVISRSGSARLAWTPEYPQSAYEILYRRKGEQAWNTCGRVASTANSAELDLSGFENFVEYHYRVVCYSEDAAEGTAIYSGSDSSPAYSLIVTPANRVAAMRVPCENEMVEVPVYAEEAADTSIRMALPSGTPGTIAVGDTDHALASAIRMDIDGEVKAALGSRGNFADSGVKAEAYMAVKERYGYSYVNPAYTYYYQYSYTNPTYTYNYQYSYTNPTYTYYYRYSYTNPTYKYLTSFAYTSPDYYTKYSYTTYSLNYNKTSYNYQTSAASYGYNKYSYSYNQQYIAYYAYAYTDYKFDHSLEYNVPWTNIKYGTYYTVGTVYGYGYTKYYTPAQYATGYKYTTYYTTSTTYGYKLNSGSRVSYYYYTTGGGGTSYGYHSTTGGGGTSYGYRSAAGGGETGYGYRETTGDGGYAYGYGYKTEFRYA